jgi:hypothetical protein
LVGEEKLSLKAAPDAIVDHPWWTPESKHHYQKFFDWAKGDGHLLDDDVLPASRYSYRSVPDAVEQLVLLPLLFLLVLIKYPSIWTVAWSLSSWVGIWIIEFMILAYQLWRSRRYGFNNRSVPFKIRVISYGVLIRFACQWGRICGHWKRLGFKCIKRFGHRFDWWIGKDADNLAKERHQDWIRFICSFACMFGFASVFAFKARS